MFKQKFFQALAVTVLMTLLLSASATVPVWAVGAIRPGFNGSSLPANDDGSTNLVPISFPIDFLGATYTHLYINNNGNVTFNSPLSTYTPFNLITTNRVIIAPFFSDVDTRIGNLLRYGVGVVDGHATFGVTWPGVNCYNRNSPAGQNFFQVLLINRSDTGPGNFDIEYNYDRIDWETGQASGGNGMCEGGGSARVGFSNGSTFSYELPGSGIPGSFLDTNQATGLIHHSLNSTQLGRYIWSVRGSVVNSSPTLTMTQAEVTVNEGTVALNTGTVSDADGDPITLTVSAGTIINNNGNWSWSFASDDGPAESQTITVFADDGNGGTAQASFALTVNNVAPVATLANNGPIDEGGVATVFFYDAFDPSSADTASLQYAFDCNGGALKGTTYAAGGTANTIECAFADNGTYLVSGRVMDKDGGSTDYSTTVIVNNVAPTVTSLVPGAARACGESNTFTVDFTDPALEHDTYTAYVDWGDGTSETFSPISSGFSPSHAYALAGQYSATIIVADEDGGSSAPSATVLTLNYTLVGGGVLPPLNQDGSSVFKYRRTVPVKIQVANCDGAISSNLTIGIFLTQLTGSAPNTIILNPASTSTADTPGFLRFEGQHYMYNLATQPLPDASAAYRITLTILHTGQTITADFKLRP